MHLGLVTKHCAWWWSLVDDMPRWRPCNPLFSQDTQLHMLVAEYLCGFLKRFADQVWRSLVIHSIEHVGKPFFHVCFLLICCIDGFALFASIDALTNHALNGKRIRHIAHPNLLLLAGGFNPDVAEIEQASNR